MRPKSGVYDHPSWICLAVFLIQAASFRTAKEECPFPPGNSNATNAHSITRAIQSASTYCKHVLLCSICINKQAEKADKKQALMVVVPERKRGQESYDTTHASAGIHW